MSPSNSGIRPVGNQRRPTVLAVHLREDGIMSGCEQYRFLLPFQEIRKNLPGAVLDWIPVGELRQLTIQGEINPAAYDLWLLPRHRPIPYGEGKAPPAQPEELRALGLPLPGTSPLADLVAIARQRIAIVLEYDDDHWGLRDFGDYQHYDLAGELLSLADAITVTTNILRDRVQSLAPGVPVYVLPNMVRFSDWQGHPRWPNWSPEAIVVGLTGSPSHYHDWKVLANVIPRLMRRFGQMAFLLAGYVPDYLAELAVKFPDRVISDGKFRPYAYYPELIRQADIILCPVDPHDKFNYCKSPIKAVEGMAAGRVLEGQVYGGAAIIASPLPYYKKVLGYGKRGLVAAHDEQSWYEAIALLLTDQGLRHRFQHLGRKYVANNLDIARFWSLWWTSYQQIFRRKRCRCKVDR